METATGGHTDLMRAVCRAIPVVTCGLAVMRFAGLRADILDYIMHYWSVVKIGTTGAQKQLFFKLLRMCSNLHEFDNGMLRF